MSVFQRLSMIFKSKANRALDSVEDPRETLDFAYQKQLQRLQEVRRHVADVATQRKRMELRIQKLQEESDKLETQSRAALTQGREDLAREALSRRSGRMADLERVKGEHQKMQKTEEELTNAAQRLQAQIDSFRTRKETIKATYTAAEAQTKVNEAFSGISEEMSDVGMAIQRAEEKTGELEARAGALDELVASGNLEDYSGDKKDDIQGELDRMASSSGVELELERLKGELGQGGGAPQQIEGNGERRPGGA